MNDDYEICIDGTDDSPWKGHHPRGHGLPHGRREGIGDGGRGKEGRQPGGTGRGFDGEGGVETIGTTELEILKTKNIQYKNCYNFYKIALKSKSELNFNISYIASKLINYIK